MRTGWTGRVMCVLAFVATGAGAWAQAPEARTVVLDTSSFWRVHYTIRPPVIRKDGAIETVDFPAKWIMHESRGPAADWMNPDFDDAAWARFPGVACGMSSIWGYPEGDAKVPFLALSCSRGKFIVTDPAKVEGLGLTVSYRGGIVVYLNGREVARGHLKKDDLQQLADDYAPDEEHDRALSVAVPKDVLRRGVNVLALEIHRAAYRPGDVEKGKKSAIAIAWGSCGLLRVRLEAANGEGIQTNVSRPGGPQVWNSSVMKLDTDLDYGDVTEPLRPIRIVGTLNGAFSGKVVVGSDAPIKGLKGRMSDLKTVDGRSVISSEAVHVRYALPDHYETCTSARYLAPASCFDGLDEVAPVEVPVREKKPNPRAMNLKSPGVSPSFGAVQPVWVTVNVPADAKPGEYEGTLTISAEGEKNVTVPVKLAVSGWKLREPHEYRTWVDIMQSPESVAMHYDVPFWSDAHFKHLEHSFKQLGRVGNKVAHLYLIAHTNAGNAETMVRWIRKPDGSYGFDISPLEKYLDLVRKHLVEPKVICLYVWDTYLEGGRGGAEQYAGQAVKDARAALKDKGPLVSVLDEATGKIETISLPMYSEPEKSLPMWRALMAKVMKALKDRGMDERAMLGISTDNQPTKEVTEFFKEVAPGVPWMSHGHAMPTDLHGVPVKYLTGVWAGGRFPKDPSEGRTYGWMRTFSGFRTEEFSAPDGAVLVHHPRNLWQVFPVTSYRLICEMNVAGQQRGFARLGGDFWTVLKDKRGRTSDLAARFPETGWRNLDIRSRLISPGARGAVATQRLEMLREGLQECEARIFIEKAILDGKIKGDLAERCQAVLDERIIEMRRGVSSLGCSSGWIGHGYVDNSWWQVPGIMGHYWYVGSDWQARSKQLYDAAAEVAESLRAN